MEVETQFGVRVLILSDVKECTITAPSSLQIRRPGAFLVARTSQPLMTVEVPARVTASGGRLSLGSLASPGADVIVGVEDPHILSLNGQRYRGELRLTVNSDGRTFNVINLVPLEPYLAGVVGAEMPDYWQPEALKAQAIASRTYCLYAKKRFGRSRDWDLSNTQASQVYHGVNSESSSVWKAVNATQGQVLKSEVRDQRLTSDHRPLTSDPLDGLIPAYFSSICGGHTEDSEHVFGDSAESLRGVPCPYCSQAAPLTLFIWPMVQVDRETVTHRLVQRYPKLEALGPINDIEVLEKSDYGQFSRLTRIRLVGESGKTDTLRAEDLRLAIDPTGRRIQSTICHIVPWGNGWAFLAGRGFGHGVGLCQYGAQGMARRGKSYREILQYYYPDSEIVNLY